MEVLSRQLVIHVEINEVIGASSVGVYKPKCSELKAWWAHLGGPQETEKRRASFSKLSFHCCDKARNKSAWWSKAIIWLTLPRHSSSTREVRARTIGGRNGIRDHRSMLLTGLLTCLCFLVYLRPICLKMGSHSELGPSLSLKIISESHSTG